MYFTFISFYFGRVETQNFSGETWNPLVIRRTFTFVYEDKMLFIIKRYACLMREKTEV